MTDSAFIISLVAVIIATASTVISYLLLRDAREPNVVVYATPDELRASVVNLVIENIGRGVMDMAERHSELLIFRSATSARMAHEQH